MTATRMADYPDAVRDAVLRTREGVSALHAELPRWDLVVWTAGNVSQRVVVHPEVALLALAYGWREQDVLTLAPHRRRAYLELA